MSFYSVSDFYKNVFSQKVYKISLDGGCTCPNRDGSKAFGGCIFCSDEGSGDFQSKNKTSIKAQIENAKKIVEKKFAKDSSKKYIAYFQNHTNTYGNVDKIIANWKEALNEKDIVGLAIATRPDCLCSKIVYELNELSKKYFVQLEFGLQSKSDKTADFINRCYKTNEYENAMKMIKKECPKVHIVTHIIFGLPFEDKMMMMESISFALKCGTDGLKITVLYVLKGTKLEAMYNEKKFETLSMNEYLELITLALSIIPKNIVIHRLTGDPPKKSVVAPLWTCDKKRVLSQINMLKNEER